ncbi:MAG: UDP-N-acetylglucosamine 2-epimerase (non-hydrolyzing) [Cyclobacteriaceae bacterium]|nr:UDP-N-acetylglucosamine 2-epimerase (non-hydrolyzing) [Cyclobacteriaceae bacterium]
MKITLVAGARPNFMKIAPIIRAIEKSNRAGNKPITYRLVHTGQHYDEKLSEVFFKELAIPEPHVNLGVGSGTQAEQTARIMMAFEKDLQANPCDLVMVVGDVNSTMACTIVAKKLNTRVAHVEGGIRSFDMTMPEEINRIVTDSLADYFFTTSEVANENLKKTGVRDEQLFFVGNTMIDSLAGNLNKTRKPAVWDDHHLTAKDYFVLTLHRPSNVDDPAVFTKLIKAISSSAGTSKVIFPVHPRTQRNAKEIRGIDNIILSDPLSYLGFIYLVQHCAGVITDSGGIQEETTWLGIPCITLRKSTERPETVTIGTNEVIGDDYPLLAQLVAKIKSGQWKKGGIPAYWDGKTAERIVAELLRLF